MNDKAINIKVKDSNTHLIENEDLLTLKVTEFANKNELSIPDAIAILNYQKSIAEGKLIAEGIEVFAIEFEKLAKSISDMEFSLRKIRRHILDGYLDPPVTAKDLRGGYHYS